MKSQCALGGPSKSSIISGTKTHSRKKTYTTTSNCARKLDIPIMCTEYAPGALYGMATWVQQRATDILRGDVAVCGGITPMIRLGYLADAFRMKCEIHHGWNSLNNVANLHVTMAIPNCDYYEVFPANGATKYALVEDIEVDDNGLVYAPTKPGLGYEIDWDLVRSETIEVV